MSKRQERAVMLYKSGYNCAQAVAIAYSDVLGMSEDKAGAIFSGFGGSFPKMRMPEIHGEEILIIALAAFLFFSKSGDKESAFMLLLLLLF